MTEPTTVHRVDHTELTELVGELRHQRSQVAKAAMRMVAALHDAGGMHHLADGPIDPLHALAEATDALEVVADRLERADDTTETILRHQG